MPCALQSRTSPVASKWPNDGGHKQHDRLASTRQLFRQSPKTRRRGGETQLPSGHILPARRAHPVRNIWERVRGCSNRAGALSPECRQLSDRLSCRHGPDGVGAGATHGGALPGFESVDSRADSVRHLHLSGCAMLHVVHPAPVRHRSGQILGHNRAHRLYEEEDPEESRGPHQRHLASGVLHLRAAYADHALPAQQHGRGQGEPQAV